ncbi:WYL domain-containing protein [Membranicola marinus]|uniref:WYL domain-containing protein n=1 Tax=Membranihabitans marinus TaxID=1227546 RepID=A0A953HX00_9BACT|nr:WYL domain-containing protein [Membranihabitans marinus]MBY5959770.1 WYL domain-containing protein [Membranihabitans marinus]
MPLNKNQQIRAQILDRCLSNVIKWYSIDDLLNHVNDHLVQEMAIEPISRRTLYTDLERLQDPDLYNADLEKKTINRKVYYRYRQKGFSITNSPITPQQLTELQHILLSLERVSNFPFGDWLDALRKNEHLPFPKLSSKQALISIEHNPDLIGMAAFFVKAFQAVVNQQVLSIDYRDFTGTDYSYTFHPYYLKQYNQRWFLIGRQEAAPDTIWNLAIDRIQNLTPVQHPFIPTSIDFDDYFYDIIGVTHQADSQLEKILLRFSEETLPYVLTKPLHPSQKTRKQGSETLIQITVKPNYELYSLLRSFGKNVEILEPTSVREAFVAELKEALDIYLQV